MAKARQRVIERDAGDAAIGEHAAEFDPVIPYIPGVRWLTDKEARAIFDREARQVMGMSGEDFLRRYDAGEFDDIPDDSEHLDFMSLVLSIPFGR